MTKDAEIQLREQRVKITSLEETLKVPFNEKVSLTAPAEMTIALRSLQTSRMWLGEAMDAIGVATPYTKSFDPTNSTIEDQHDRGEVIAVSDEDGESEITFLKWLRHEILPLCNQLKGNFPLFETNGLYQLSVKNAYTHLKQAQMWLGVALGVIRDKEQEQPVSASATRLPVDSNEKELDPKTVPPVTPTAKVSSAKKTGTPVPSGKVASTDKTRETSVTSMPEPPVVNPADMPPPPTLEHPVAGRTSVPTPPPHTSEQPPVEKTGMPESTSGDRKNTDSN